MSNEAYMFPMLYSKGSKQCEAMFVVKSKLSHTVWETEVTELYIRTWVQLTRTSWANLTRTLYSTRGLNGAMLLPRPQSLVIAENEWLLARNQCACVWHRKFISFVVIIRSIIIMRNWSWHSCKINGSIPITRDVFDLSTNGALGGRSDCFWICDK